MKKLKKIIRFFDRVEDTILFLFCVLLFLIGLYALIDSYLVYQHANDDSLLKYKYNYEEAEKEIKGHMVAWLTVDDTNIDYPVMQGENNEEYLNKDPYGDYAMSGSIFLDSRNKADFADPYSLIYGHHMEGKYMFGSLHSYLKKKYFKKHQNGELIVGDTTYDMKIFAVLNVEATQDIVFSPTESDQSEVLAFIKDHAEVCDKKIADQLTAEDRIVAMSTCKYPNSIYRIIVFAKLEHPHKTVKADN